MNRETYRKTAEYINSHTKLKSIVSFTEKYSSKPSVIIFFGLLFYLTIKLDARVFAVGAVPFAVFCLVTFIRKKLNFKRPFEEIGFESVVPHSTGNGCPSRHAASCTVISMAAFFISIPLGIISSVFSLIVCISRVITGVHYIRDVLWGAFIGMISGYIVYFIIL